MSPSSAIAPVTDAQVGEPATAPAPEASAAGEELLRDALAAETPRVSTSGVYRRLRFTDEGFRPFRVY